MDKKQHIEEMAKIVDEMYNVYTTTAEDIAEGLYNEDYRNIDDDCAVITKDDLNLYKKQAVKDTAKEICDLILEHWEEKQFVECDWLRVAIAEKYGVELTE